MTDIIIKDYLGFEVNTGDEVIYLDSNRNRSWRRGKVISYNWLGYTRLKIMANDTKAIIERNAKQVINLTHIKNSNAEYFI